CDVERALDRALQLDHVSDDLRARAHGPRQAYGRGLGGAVRGDRRRRDRARDSVILRGPHRNPAFVRRAGGLLSLYRVLRLEWAPPRRALSAHLARRAFFTRD